MEGDPSQSMVSEISKSFQSTPSAWRETARSPGTHHAASDFNPLPPHGGRLSHRHAYGILIAISIHSLRMEGDSGDSLSEGTHKVFQSTPSAWRETMFRSADFTVFPHFNPLPPHGGRPATSPMPTITPHAFQSTPSAWRETASITSSQHSWQSFQSTPSAWRETRTLYFVKLVKCISIHSLRMEGDASA